MDDNLGNSRYPTHSGVYRTVEWLVQPHQLR